MSPSELRKSTLKDLRATRRMMMSTDWRLELEKKLSEAQTEEEKNKIHTDSAMRMLQVHHLIQKLETAELGEIRDKLLENENDLANGLHELKAAMEGIDRVKSVLNAVEKLLLVLGRVVSVLAFI